MNRILKKKQGTCHFFRKKNTWAVISYLLESTTKSYTYSTQTECLERFKRKTQTILELKSRNKLFIREQRFIYSDINLVISIWFNHNRLQMEMDSDRNDAAQWRNILLPPRKQLYHWCLLTLAENGEKLLLEIDSHNK